VNVEKSEIQLKLSEEEMSYLPLQRNLCPLGVKQASNAALASLLNLTVLPLIGFTVLLFLYKKSEPGTFGRDYVVISLKLNLLAAVALLLVSGLMVAVGGFDSPMSWIYMLSYFVTVHAFFILVATWALVRAGSGKRLK